MKNQFSKILAKSWDRRGRFKTQENSIPLGYSSSDCVYFTMVDLLLLSLLNSSSKLYNS